MNDFSAKALLLWAALEKYGAIPAEWRRGLLDGMFWLTDELLVLTRVQPKHAYEHSYVKTIQQYVEKAFKHPEHEISELAVDLCSRILSGIPDESGLA